jgi:hypothetical protein
MELANTDLDQVTGGMDCDTAVGVAATHACTAAALSALGELGLSQVYAGKALGVLEGAGCPK